MKYKFLIIFSLFLISICGVASAVVTESSNIDSDAHIYSESGGNNNYNTNNLQIYKYGDVVGENEYRTLIKENDILSNIPSDANIINAEVYLYNYDSYTTQNVFINKITSSWTESTVTWNTQPTFSGSSTDTISVSSGWMVYNITDDFQDFVDGTSDNYGWMLFVTPVSMDYEKVFFRSSEYTDDINKRPYLTVDYTTDYKTRTENSTIVEEESATLNCYVYDVSGDDAECGFLVSNQTPVTTGNALFNVTTDITDYPDSYQKTVNGLTPGEYYYVKSYINDSDGFTLDETVNETQFLTKPNPPTNLVVQSYNTTNITLTWSNSTVGSGTNQSTVIVYKEGSQPTSVTDGTIGYNGTAETTVITGLNYGSTYYFSAFTYVNDTGSPFLWHFSDSFTSTSATTEGGSYNVTFRWECNQTLIDDTLTPFQNSVLLAETVDGEVLYRNTSITSNPTTIETSETPGIIRFNYNQSGAWRCIIPDEDQTNITIYVCCYENWDNVDTNYTNYQLLYKLGFLDYSASNIWDSNKKTHLQIYKYNDTGIFYVYEDYWDVSNSVEAYLHYGERYWFGIKNDKYHIEFLQYFDASTSLTTSGITVSDDETEFFTVNDFVSMETYRSDNKLYVNYTDGSYSTEWCNISIYRVYGNNDSQEFITSTNFTTSTNSYSFISGFNTSHNYMVKIKCNIDEADNIGTITIFSSGVYYNPKIDIDWISNLFNDNIIDVESGIGISIGHLMLFFLSFTFLIVGGTINASVGLLGSGSILILSMAALFSFSPVFNALGIMVGGLLVIFGFITMRMGGD